MITVSGKGNVALLEAPKVNFPPDFEVYDTKTTQNTDKSNGGTTGSKTFEYPFIPRSAGEFTIEPVSYSYYDVSAGKYVTLTTDPMTIRVAKGSSSEGSTPTQVVVPSNRKDVKDLGSDIRYITSKVPSLSSGGSFFLGSGFFWTLLVLMLAGAAGTVFGMNKMSERKADVVGTKNRKATKMAKQRLAQAQQYLSKNIYSAFYEELHKALLGFVSDKMNMDMADLSKENIAEALASRNVPEDVVSQYTSLLDACEFARYAPDSGHEAMDAHFNDAVSVISSIDSSMKAKKTSGAKAVVSALIIMLAVPGISRASENNAYVDSLWTSAVTAYADGQFAEAAQQWSSIASLGLESPELYYNLGNAWFKSGETSRAILNYERALKLDPSYSDARYNLDFANSFAQDKIEPVPEFILKTAMRKVCYMMDSNAWAVVFLILLAATLAMAVVFLMSSTSGARKTGFFSAIALLVLALCSVSFSAWQKSDYIKADSAIVMAPVASVKSSPSAEGSKDLFILHEGTKVTLIDEVGQWKNIELADGRQGWIKSSDLEVI